MAGVQVGFKIDDAQVRDLFQRAPQMVTTRLKSLVEAAAIDVQQAAGQGRGSALSSSWGKR